MSDKKSKGNKSYGPGVYKIRVNGHLNHRWKEWLGCQCLTPDNDHTTTLICDLPDQTALHGVLQRIRDLNLKLISFEIVEESSEEDQA